MNSYIVVHTSSQEMKRGALVFLFQILCQIFQFLRSGVQGAEVLAEGEPSIRLSDVTVFLAVELLEGH